VLPFIFEAQTMAIQLVGNKLVGLYETADPFELKTLPVGIHTYLLTTGGNSLLSSLFVASCPSGASITVRYYSQTTGDGADERTPLTNHNPITAPQTAADQIIVTRIHNKTYVEVEILGAPVEFGLEVTVISTFAVDLSAATKKDNAPFVPLTDQGLPIVILDRTTDTYQIWGGDNGVPKVEVLGTIESTFARANMRVEGFASVAPADVVDVLTYTVPVSKVFTLLKATVSCLGDFLVELNIDGEVWDVFQSSFFNRTGEFAIPVEDLAAGSVVKLTATSRTVFGSTNEVRAYLIGKEF